MKNITKPLMTMALLMLTMMTYAAKPKVIVDYFYFGGRVSSYDMHTVDRIRQKIITDLINTGRVDVIDAMTEARLGHYKAQDREAGDFYNRYSSAKIYGADYVITGDIDCLSITHNSVGDGFHWDMGYALQVVNLTDNTILGKVQSDKPEYNGFNTVKSDDGIDIYAGRISSALKQIFMNNIKTRGEVLQIVTSKTKKGATQAGTLAIGIGTNDGIAVGWKFNVFALNTVAGRQVEDQIGQIKVTAIKGVDISYGMVKKGGDVIYDAIQRGTKLVVVSADAGFWD